jgi:peptidoglycan/xylan/chitin deacetylase (PgdA/CDA1 family)
MSDGTPSQIVRYRRGPGYDHDHFDYTPLPERPALAWPGGKRIAFCVYLYLEYLELDPPEATVRDPRYGGALGSYFPDYLNYSHREYGNRVGVFRLLEALDRHGLKATVAANAMLAERCPELIEACRARGFEIAAHGVAATRMISSRMGKAEERATIAHALEAVARVSGTRPVGWFGQDFGESSRTPGLLAEAGLSYVADWPNDDQPYAMKVGKPLVAMPNQAEWDDTQLMAIRRVTPPRWRDVVCEAFEYLHEEASPSASVFTLGLHPWLVGQAHRVRYLREALDRMAGYDEVWQATAAEVADWYREGTARP